MQMIFKSLLVSNLLLSPWPKQVTHPVLNSVWEGTTQGRCTERHKVSHHRKEEIRSDLYFRKMASAVLDRREVKLEAGRSDRRMFS